MATKTLDLEILSVSSPIFTKTPRGGYSSLELAYKNLTFEGKVEGKKLVDFNDKAVFEFIKELKQGDKVTIVAEKGENDQFWKWTEANYTGNTPSAGVPQASGEAGPSVPSEKATGRSGSSVGRVTGSNYETSDERAKRQVYIVRQSSISASLEYHKNTDAVDQVSSVEEIIETAKAFEKYVFE